MAFYSLERQKDGECFQTSGAGDDDALWRLSQEVGENLTFAGDGPPDYLLNRSDDPNKGEWVSRHIPVYGERKAT